jgi:hypothetical protein
MENTKNDKKVWCNPFVGLVQTQKNGGWNPSTQGSKASIFLRLSFVLHGCVEK